MPTKHAKLSASSAGGWSNCPGFIHMTELFPQDHGSAAADEGTLAHELAERMISYPGKPWDDIATKVNRFYKDHPELSGSMTEMTDYISAYRDYVMGEYVAARRIDGAAQLCTEQRVGFHRYVPGGFGTSDVVITYGDTIEIIDLKYGKGVAVSAVNNPQIRLYALGSIDLFDIFEDFKTVKMVIYQPRLESVTEETMAVADLTKWAEDVIVPAAKEALSDHPSYHPGSWCTSKFCPGAHACRARAEWLLEVEKYEKDPALLSREEIGDVLNKVGPLTKWATQLKSFALNELNEGRPIPGWKIVEGRSVREYTDRDKVLEALLAAGYEKPILLTTPELLGITALERVVGKSKFKKLLEAPGLVVKPKGSPTLAQDADSRPVFANVSADDFDA